MAARSIPDRVPLPDPSSRGIAVLQAGVGRAPRVWADPSGSRHRTPMTGSVNRLLGKSGDLDDTMSRVAIDRASTTGPSTPPPFAAILTLPKIPLAP